jgi:cyclophilin family peptidyl-prolyl cis-trans isomerase
MRKYTVVLALLLVASACGGSSDSEELGSEELGQTRAELDTLMEQIASTTTLPPDDDEPGWDDPYAECRGTSHCENAPAGYGSWDEYDAANDPNYELATTTTATPATTDCPTVDKSDEPRLSFSSRPTWCLDDGATYMAVFDTTEGEIRVVLDRERTPETVNNFVVLTRYGYYDNTLLFRFDPSIAIIQGGAPKTNGWSDPGPGYTIPDEGGEFLSGSDGGLIGPFTYQPGDLVMARSAGPNSSGAQFFFATGPEVGLLDAQGTYIVFGHAEVAGQAVLEAMMGLYQVDETSPYGGGPTREVMVKSVTIVVD